MTATRVRIINHTHWDREWFLTAVYTGQWIAGLIDKIEDLVENNQAFRYLFDGQTLVMEDLLAVDPAYRPKVERLIQNGNLIIGPYYCQPDWQLTAGESLMRNLEIGLQDTAHYGGRPTPGWLVDTFGHISQAPQIHRWFNIHALYVWRGVPRLAPFFEWQGSHGRPLLGINLFGGYRNLYGITHVPEIAAARLEQEVARLDPYYAPRPIPLFDGYDLEDNPEDPVNFYLQNGRLPSLLEIQEGTSSSYAAVIQGSLETNGSLPIIEGELISGKFGAIFPGTYSARTYQKVAAFQCETLLYRLTEPLAAMAHGCGRPFNADFYRAQTRHLLQNAVHDCICGVSIDQVHEKMDAIYRQVFDVLLDDAARSLETVMADFAAGDYAVVTLPLPASWWVAADDRLYQITSTGWGIQPLGEGQPLEFPETPAELFSWHNDYYQAEFDPHTGTCTVNRHTVGEFRVSIDNGDTYSDESGPLLGALTLQGAPTIEETAPGWRVIRLQATLSDRALGLDCRATIRLIFDPSPLIRWQVELDSTGVDFRIEMVFRPLDSDDSWQVKAAMPFDIVSRPAVDRDLLPRELAGDLQDILMGQRELGEMRTYPFYEFVGVERAGEALAVLAQGARAYRVEDDGAIYLTLRRAVEWVTRADLATRVGDAGPFFYVPDARCERPVYHEIAFYCGFDSLDSPEFLAVAQAFHQPPLIVSKSGEGSCRQLSVGAPPAPISGLSLVDGRLVARVYNPTQDPLSWAEPLAVIDYRGQEIGSRSLLEPKEILALRLDGFQSGQQAAVPECSAGAITVANWPQWAVGANHGRPDLKIIEQLAAKATALATEVARLEFEIDSLSGRERLLATHRFYIARRELYEMKLTIYLNEDKLGRIDDPSTAHLFQLDPTIAELGRELNQMRIKRRIFDYVARVV